MISCSQLAMQQLVSDVISSSLRVWVGIVGGEMDWSRIKESQQELSDGVP